jgi:hypothetical protein
VRAAVGLCVQFHLSAVINGMLLSTWQLELVICMVLFDSINVLAESAVGVNGIQYSLSQQYGIWLDAVVTAIYVCYMVAQLG